MSINSGETCLLFCEKRHSFAVQLEFCKETKIEAKELQGNNGAIMTSRDFEGWNDMGLGVGTLWEGDGKSELEQEGEEEEEE